MKLRSFIRILENPQILIKYIKTGKKDEARKILQIIESRKKMNDSCMLSDILMEQKIPIHEITEIVSKRIDITKYPIAWYCLVRKHKPKLVVETGTSMGWSSYMILTAILRNKIGHLYSFDIDDSQNVKNYGGVGYLVTEDQKKNWTLTIGDTRENLEPLYSKLKEIDMFIHDSEHSYETMMYEYSVSWEHLKKNGILASDDINHSTAFEEFTKKHANEIFDLIEFEEISRNTDVEFKRPKVGYFFKKT